MSMQIAELSKTYQYRKVMKPMLERKRRARINKCLDELKDLMVATLESEGEHVTRLEKADILELTVSHLQKLKHQRNQTSTKGGVLSKGEGFRSGYIHAVNEVSRSLSELPGVNVNLGTQLMSHLGQRLNQLQPAAKPPVPVTAPLSVHINNAFHKSHQYSVPISPISSTAGSPTFSSENDKHNAYLLTTCTNSLLNLKTTRSGKDDEGGEENVWRPW